VAEAEAGAAVAAGLSSVKFLRIEARISSIDASGVPSALLIGHFRSCLEVANGTGLESLRRPMF
jgi:hypothetical protein